MRKVRIFCCWHAYAPICIFCAEMYDDLYQILNLEYYFKCVIRFNDLWQNLTKCEQWLRVSAFSKSWSFQTEKTPNFKQVQLYNWLRWDKIVFCNSDVSIRTNMRITGQLLGPLRQISTKIHLVFLGVIVKKKIHTESLLINYSSLWIDNLLCLLCVVLLFNRSFSFIYLSSKLNIKKHNPVFKASFI